MVMSFGSSAEPIGGGSTYLRVVRSAILTVSECKSSVERSTRTLLCVDLHLHVKVDAQDDEIGDHVENTDAQEYLGVVKRYFFRYLHHAENDD